MHRFRPPFEPLSEPPASVRSGAPFELSPSPALPAGLPGRVPGSMGPLGLEFLVQILSAELDRRPENRGALTSLSQCLGQLGRHREGCRINQRLVRLMPEHPVAYYNLACSQALLGEEGEALRSLQAAIDFGFSDAEFLASDPDLASLRDTPPFRALLHSLRKGTPRA